MTETMIKLTDPSFHRTLCRIGLFGDIGIILVGALLLVLWDLSGLDLAAVRMFGTARGFSLKDAFVPSMLLHQGGRWLSLALLVWLLVNALWPLPPAVDMSRVQRWGWLAVTVLCLALVSSLKQASLTSCPWDLAEFGGTAHYVSHWQFGVADGGGGRCFPAGHPSAAFGFFAGYFALRPWNRRAARLWLTGVIGLGILFGVAQLVRGAHYPSHTFYTAWLCWTLTAVLYNWANYIGRRRASKRDAAPPGSD